MRGGDAILATYVDKVAAWFVDSDYDGRTFCITQAFFPDKSAWHATNSPECPLKLPLFWPYPLGR